jgi:hypothetical protein
MYWDSMKLKIIILILSCLAFSAFATISFIPKKLNENSLYFDKEPFINPKLIDDLTTSLADTGNQVVAIDLVDAQSSNRYFCELAIKNIKNENPIVSYKEEDGANLGYQLIGKTHSGIYILRTYEYGQGSGVFEELLFIKFEKEKFLSYESNTSSLNLTAERLLIKKLGSIGLGDRYEGEIKINGDKLFIEKDKKLLSSYHKDTVIKMNFER